MPSTLTCVSQWVSQCFFIAFKTDFSAADHKLSSKRIGMLSLYGIKTNACAQHDNRNESINTASKRAAKHTKGIKRPSLQLGLELLPPLPSWPSWSCLKRLPKSILKCLNSLVRQPTSRHCKRVLAVGLHGLHCLHRLRSDYQENQNTLKAPVEYLLFWKNQQMLPQNWWHSLNQPTNKHLDSVIRCQAFIAFIGAMFQGLKWGAEAASSYQQGSWQKARDMKKQISM